MSDEANMKQKSKLIKKQKEEADEYIDKLQKIIDDLKVDLPEILIEVELNKILYSLCKNNFINLTLI